MLRSKENYPRNTTARLANKKARENPIRKLLCLLGLVLLVVAMPLRADDKEKKKDAEAKVIRARFQKPIDSLRTLLSGKDHATILDNLAKEGRGPAFALEGLCKLYEDRYSEFSPYHDAAKRLEDQLGWYIDTRDHLKLAAEMGLTAKKDPKVLKSLQAEKIKHETLLLDILKKDGWLGGSPILGRVEQQLTDTKWDSLKEDHDYLAKRLMKHVQKHLIDAEYDMSDLQGGLHKFRREMRWLLIYGQALNGLVVLDDRELKKTWQEILTDPISKSLFTKLPPPEAQDFHIYFPRALYFELTKAVQDLGDAKDTGEAESQWLFDALHLSGAEPDIALAKKKAIALAKKSPKYVQRETADAVEKRIRGGKLLKLLSDTFDDQRSWGRKACLNFGKLNSRQLAH